MTFCSGTVISTFSGVCVCVCMLTWNSGSRTAKPTSYHGKNVKMSINGPSVEEGNVVSLLWAGEWDGPLHISEGNTLAAQVRLHLAI